MKNIFLPIIIIMVLLIGSCGIPDEEPATEETVSEEETVIEDQTTEETAIEEEGKAVAEEDEDEEEEEETVEPQLVKEPKPANSSSTPSLNIPKYKDSHFGFDHADDAYDHAVALGVHWERPHPGPVVWGYIEQDKGKYQWDMVDSYVKKAQDYDFNLMLTIFPFADWDQITCHGIESQGAGFERTLPLNRCKPCDISAYQEFIRNVVERYDGDGNQDMPGLRAGIKYWEVSNEPSMQEGRIAFFKGTSQDYLDILKVTYEAVKEADHGAKVLHAGMAG